MRERLVDVMLFLLGQTGEPSREDWLSAIDDLFGELGPGERGRLADAGMALMTARTEPRATPLRLVHTQPQPLPLAGPPADSGRAQRLEAVA